MRILWLSNAPWCKTGYGVQTALFTKRLNESGHPVAMQAFWGLEGAPATWNGMRVYPKAYHPYGMDAVEANADDWKADVVITLLDAWVLDPSAMENIRWCPWFPVDHQPLPERIEKIVRKAWQPLVFSRFGDRLARMAKLSPMYIPHGFDATVYWPMEQREARAALGWEADTFMVGIVAANKGWPSRKALPQQLEAFARFHARHPKSYLYVHTVAGLYGEEGGVNLPELVAALEIADAVTICDQYKNMLGYDEGTMRAIYSGLDVLLNVSMGEGFGVPIIEAQACGCPVIVGDWTAMPEICFGGYRVPVYEAEPYWTQLGAYQFLPHVEAIDTTLEIAFEADAVERRAMREKARAGVMEFDADRVTKEFWLPRLEGMGERMKDEGENFKYQISSVKGEAGG